MEGGSSKNKHTAGVVERAGYCTGGEFIYFSGNAVIIS